MDESHRHSIEPNNYTQKLYPILFPQSSETGQRNQSGGGVTSQDSGYLWARTVAGRVSNGGFWNAGNALLFIRWWLYGWINFVKIYQALCFLLMDFSVCVLYFL